MGIDSTFVKAKVACKYANLDKKKNEKLTTSSQFISSPVVVDAADYKKTIRIWSTERNGALSCRETFSPSLLGLKRLMLLEKTSAIKTPTTTWTSSVTENISSWTGWYIAGENPIMSSLKIFCKIPTGCPFGSCFSRRGQQLPWDVAMFALLRKRLIIMNEATKRRDCPFQIVALQLYLLCMCPANLQTQCVDWEYHSVRPRAFLLDISQVYNIIPFK